MPRHREMIAGESDHFKRLIDSAELGSSPEFNHIYQHEHIF